MLEASEVNGEVTARAKVKGAGVHQIELKVYNLASAETSRKVILAKGEDTELQWSLKVNDPSKPWIAVAIPESAPDFRKDVFGRVGAFTELS